ncbi:MAG: M28 family peptidase [Chloroflexi bacterium]|nr:M28 family peptidase [Chloroflexota bacterium]
MGRQARWGSVAGVMVVLALLVGCGSAAPPEVVTFKTATPYATATPHPTATPRPLAVLEPTATVAAPTRAVLAPTTTAGAAAATATPAETRVVQPANFEADNAYRHVEELSIGLGPRAAGTEAEGRGADYVADQLTAYGYTVTRQPFSITTFQDNGSTLTLDVDPRQVQPLAMYYSGAGQIDGLLAAGGMGAPADYLGDVARGKIVLVERGGGLSFLEKARNARAGGAIGMIVYNSSDGPVQGSLTEPFDLPVVSISRADGLRLRRLLDQRPIRAALKVNVTTEQKPSQNVLAVAPGARSRLPLIVIGGQLDTVAASPGANNNGSGIGVILELARVLARDQRADLRFVAFGAQEIGLVGSRTYVERLTSDEKNRLVAMINIDMIAVGQTLTFAGTDELVTRALALAERLQVGKTARLAATQRTGQSDHLSFLSANLPAIYIHRPDDPNFQTGQDRAQFVKLEALQQAGLVSLRLVEQLLEKQSAAVQP